MSDYRQLTISNEKYYLVFPKKSDCEPQDFLEIVENLVSHDIRTSG